MKTNKRPGNCYYCGNRVEANAGVTWSGGKKNGRWRKWRVAHLACAEAEGPEVTVTRFASGATVKQNKRGRCIDAPCCGCCD
jgi:hypothetical protein